MKLGLLGFGPAMVLCLSFSVPVGTSEVSAGTHPSPKAGSIQDLRLGKDQAQNAVTLAWTQGAPPFHVLRNGIELTPVAGIAQFSWSDVGALHDGFNYYYTVN